jgi:hypothetical protein
MASELPRELQADASIGPCDEPGSSHETDYRTAGWK